ncbi:MAG: hypothetical protein L6R40_004376 [Gallowayella cf. fulva]|nr:MAG: hypothetical protein L6R40_004376 [Xanthomendoza cf. fulva]
MASNEQEPGPPGARSSLSRTFSADLNDAFSIDKKLDGLVQSVEQKKQAVSSQSQELEALEAKLRETEEKLKEKQISPPGKATNDTRHTQQAPSLAYGAPSQKNPPASEVTAVTTEAARSAGQAPSENTMSYWRPPMPGALPETPDESRQNSYLGAGRDNT